MILFGIKANLTDTHLVVPSSRLSVKVIYQGHVLKKYMAVEGAFVFHKHILFKFGNNSISDWYQGQGYLSKSRSYINAMF